MTGTTVFPSCPFVCVVSAAAGGVDPRSIPDGAPNSATTGGGVVGGGGNGEPGDEPGLGIPCGTTIGGKRYMRHQLIPPPGLRSEPAIVRRVSVWGTEGGCDGGCEGARGESATISSSW
jgi:hypothetical protein